MDRSRPAERAQLIRASVVIFAILALLSFALAHTQW